MPRVRISTTVDAERLETARRLLDANDAAMMDRALAALVDELEGERERAALEAMPYDEDPELAWEAPGSWPPYDGEVPDSVRRLARRRRR